MECQHCGYSLWNIKSRKCPECGSGFKPSDYDFIPGSVAYSCPHCQQQYFGLDSHGHLTPRAFACENCDQPIDMDQMILQPAEGFENQVTQATDNPWEVRLKNKSTFVYWVQVCLRALFRPGDLATTGGCKAYYRSGWFFLLITWSLVYTLGLTPFQMMLYSRSYDRNLLLFQLLGMLGGWAGGIVFGFLIIVLAVVVWAGITHGMLKILGRPTHQLAETYDGLCMTSGTACLLTIPIIGLLYLGWYVALWWPVSAAMVLARQHHMSRFKSLCAVGFLPLVLFGGIAGYIGYDTYRNMMSWNAFVAPQQSVASVGKLILQQENPDGSMGPDHILRLVFKKENQDWLNVLADSSEWQGGFGFVDDGFQEGCNRLGTLAFYNGDHNWKPLINEWYANVIDALDAMPPIEGPGYRFGGMLFVYNKITNDNFDPDLWLIVQWPRVAKVKEYLVFKADGTELRLAYNELMDGLDEQNALRRKLNLPEIGALDQIRIVPLPIISDLTYDLEQPQTLKVGSEILKVRQPDGQVGPDHILRLLLNGKLSTSPFEDMDWNLNSSVTRSLPENWHGNWPENAADHKKAYLIKQLDNLPKRSGPGYRFGQVLLVYDGIAEKDLNPELWLAIRWPKNYNPEQTRIYKADGHIMHVLTDEFQTHLQKQEQLRKQLGLPALGSLNDIQQISFDIPKVDECACENDKNKDKESAEVPGHPTKTDE